jgi:hypothetical protein
MDPDTVVAIAAVVSAAIAIGAAVSSKLSADRSAAAEERSARAAVRSASAAEDALNIERARRAEEEQDRERAAVPVLHAGETSGTYWLLRGNTLYGTLENEGPGTAVIQSITLDLGPFGGREGDWDRARAVFGPGDVLPVEVRWKAEPHDLDLRVVVRFVAPSRAGYEVAFMLHPVGGAADGTPMWRAASAELQPLA